MDYVFLEILNMSFTASFVILFVLMARLFLKKAPKLFSYALWSVVLFRLICPFSFESMLSILPINSNPIPMEILYDKTPQIDSGIPFINQVINPMIPAPDPIYVSSVNPLQIWTTVARVLWLGGFFLMICYSVYSFLRLKKHLQESVHVRENIYLVETIESPFVVGLIHPKIYLPTNLSETEQSYILLHEQTHIKRKDHLVKFLSFFVLCLHWFNPLVWLAFFMSSKDMEMACDENVIKTIGNGVKKEYSTTLLSFAINKRMVRATPLAFGEGDTKQRIKNVLNYRKPTFWVSTLATLLVVVVAMGLMVNPKKQEEVVWGNSAKDVYNQYVLLLAANDIEGMRTLTPTLNPPSLELQNQWKQMKISDIELLSEDVRTDKAEFEFRVNVSQVADGFDSWNKGTSTQYLYVEKSSMGWYVESHRTQRRSQEELKQWWSQSNLVQGSGASAQELWNARTPYVGDNTAISHLLGLLPIPTTLTHNSFELLTSDQERGIHWLLDAKDESYSKEDLDQAVLLFYALVDNLEDLTIRVSHDQGEAIFQYHRPWINEWVGGDIKDYGLSVNSIEDLMNKKIIQPLSAMRPMVRVEGVLYMDTNKIMSEGEYDYETIGQIDSEVETTMIPQENNQSNFHGIGAKYAYDGENLVVWINEKWILFELE